MASTATDRTATGDAPGRGSLFTRLYTGTGAFDIVGQRRRWYLVFGVVIGVCLLAMVLRGFNLGIDFTGGTQVQFPTAGVSTPATQERVADVFAEAVGEEPSTVQTVGSGPSESVLIRSEQLTPEQLVALEQALFETFAPVGADGVPTPEVISDTAVSGTWGGQITQQALLALAVFLVLVSIFLAFYFERAMAVAALVALLHDVVVTLGVYAIVGFEVTPATVIGLLTILGFSLYDTVVVFDKVKENSRGLLGLTRRTYPEAANLALNQTLMRSINTSLIAVLPVVGLMVIGVGLLGVGTLADLALVLMVGITAGVVSSVLLATPVLVDLKMRDTRFAEHEQKVFARRARVAGGRDAGRGGEEPDLADDAAGDAELRRERAMAAAAGVPTRPGKTARPSGKRRR